MADRGRLARFVGCIAFSWLVWAGVDASLVRETAAGTSRRCCACLVGWDVKPPSGGRPGMGYFMISVDRPFAELAPLTDPQSWSFCNPLDFAASNVAMPSACSTGNAAPLPSPPAPGSTWSGPLFEHFRVLSPPTQACDPNQSRFRNILEIAAVRTATSLRYDYGLCDSIDHRVNCTDGPGGITWDCGFTALQQDGAGSVLKGVKYLRFADGLGVNAWVEAGMRAMIDDIRDHEVCCGMTGSVECPKCAPPERLHVTPPAPLCPSAP